MKSAKAWVARIRGEMASIRRNLVGGHEPKLMEGQLQGLQDWSAEDRAIRFPIAREFILDKFKPDDRVAVFFMLRATDRPDLPAMRQRFTSARNAADPEYLDWFLYQNREGYDVSISANALQPGATRRTRENIGEIRTIALDLDQEGPRRLQSLMSRTDLPKPNWIVETSPGRYHVHWQASGFSQELAERVTKRLAADIGGDPQATDITRVLRLPGFDNRKYESPVLVTADRAGSGTTNPEMFPARYREVERRPEAPVLERNRGYLQPERPDPSILVGRALERAVASRNGGGFWLATQLRDNGFDQRESERIMDQYRLRVLPTDSHGRRDPYTRHEMLASLRSAFERPAREPWRPTREMARTR
jgi:hypothetical protein